MLLYAKMFYERLIRMKKNLLIMLFLLAVAPAAQAMTVTHDFAVRLGVFDASRTRFSYSLTTKDYSVRSTVATNGLFDTLYPFKAEYATTGKIKKDGLETASYKYKSRSRFNSRRKELVYNNRGEPIYRISAKNDKEKKVEIEQRADSKDTTDLQTVMAKLALQYNQLKFCAARMQVFDGKRRYDVIFKDEGQDTLPATEKSPFSGTAAKCSMYIDKLGEKGDDLLWDLTKDRPIYFWIMEETNSKAPFIAKIKIDDTPLGELEVHTTNITIED